MTLKPAKSSLTTLTKRTSLNDIVNNIKRINDIVCH